MPAVLSIYIEILSISFFIRGRLNRAIRSEECLWNPNSRLHTKLQFSSLKNKKFGKPVQNGRCAVQNVHCAVVLGQIWLHGSNGLEKRSLWWEFPCNWSKIEKTAGKWALEPVCPFPIYHQHSLKSYKLGNIEHFSEEVFF